MNFEDTLDYLPNKPVRQYQSRTIIYNPQNPGQNLYLVVSGRVKIIYVAFDGTQTIVRIAAPEGLFGEPALLGPVEPREVAVALDRVTVMSWTPDELTRYIERMPGLGLALTRYFVVQSNILQARIVSMAAYAIPERVSMALIQLAAALGKPTQDGAMRIASLTQCTIAEYVGTSREMLSLHMNHLRRRGFIRYSRQYIDVYTQLLSESLLEKGVNVNMTSHSGVLFRRAAG